jgi:hypothetical protein
MAKAERAVWVSALVVLLMMSPALLSYAGESNVRKSAGMISLWMDDGLELVLRRSDGKAKELRIEGGVLKLNARIGRKDWADGEQDYRSENERRKTHDGPPSARIVPKRRIHHHSLA